MSRAVVTSVRKSRSARGCAGKSVLYALRRLATKGNPDCVETLNLDEDRKEKGIKESYGRRAARLAIRAKNLASKALQPRYLKGRPPVITHHKGMLTASKDSGVTPERLMAAGKNYVQIVYGKKARAILAIHEDTANLHLHYVVLPERTDGSRIHLSLKKINRQGRIWAKLCSKELGKPEIYREYVNREMETRDWKKQKKESLERGEPIPAKKDRSGDHWEIRNGHVRTWDDERVGLLRHATKVAGKKIDYLKATSARGDQLEAVTQDFTHLSSRLELVTEKRLHARSEVQRDLPPEIPTISGEEQIKFYKRGIELTTARQQDFDTDIPSPSQLKVNIRQRKRTTKYYKQKEQIARINEGIKPSQAQTNPKFDPQLLEKVDRHAEAVRAYTLVLNRQIQIEHLKARTQMTEFGFASSDVAQKMKDLSGEHFVADKTREAYDGLYAQFEIENSYSVSPPIKAFIEGQTDILPEHGLESLKTGYREAEKLLPEFLKLPPVQHFQNLDKPQGLSQEATPQFSQTREERQPNISEEFTLQKADELQEQAREELSVVEQPGHLKFGREGLTKGLEIQQPIKQIEEDLEFSL